ncbi:hypothetical protein BOM24_13760, partial [Tatumella sp. OPLPL6]
SNLLIYLPNMFFALQQLGGNLYVLFKETYKFFLISLSMYLCLITLNNFLIRDLDIQMFLHLLIMIFIGAIFYILMVYFFDRKIFKELKGKV